MGMITCWSITDHEEFCRSPGIFSDQTSVSNSLFCESEHLEEMQWPSLCVVMRHLTNGGRHLISFRTQKMELISCPGTAVTAIVDIKHKHEEVKAKFDVGPFQTKKRQSLLWTLWSCVYAQHDNNPTDVPLQQRTSEPG